MTEEKKVLIMEPNYIEVIADELWYSQDQVQVVIELIEEWATVPFIARYRKEKTGNLDEDAIRSIVDMRTKQENLFKAKQTALNGIDELWKLTPELLENILQAKTLKEVEEIYKPYKSKKKTKAMIAIEKGFQVVADSMKKNGDIIIPQDLLDQYSQEEILEWAHHIVVAEITANAELRDDLRETLQKYNSIVSKIKTEKSLEKLNEKDKKQIPKFEIYSDFSCPIFRLKPYQILALNRGEDLGILAVKIEKTDKTYEGLQMHYARLLKVRIPFSEALEEAFKEGYAALFKSVETEVRGILSEKGEDDAINTFQDNLAKLLLTKPEYGKKLLAIDPGFAAGCKIAVLDELGTPVIFDKIFLHSKTTAKVKLKQLLKDHGVDVVVVWNGTGVNETVELLKEVTDNDIMIVNESGASVYSASKIAQEEFPDLDSLDRGTVSIARRYIDPLSELVKVPVGSIGVGMYQHDMPVKKLEEKLGYVVEDVVNEVWINVNSASVYVLNHISGIDKRAAKKIYNHRPYNSRADLKKQLSDKVYQQAAGFLRVPESTQQFDNTDIHPDQYGLATYIIENNISGADFENYKTEILDLYADANKDTLEFILASYSNMGKDPRVNSTHKKASIGLTMESVKEGDILDGVVRNVVAFGAFVDIGLKNDGLVHISQLADGFISDPKQVVEVGQNVKVKLTGIDKETGKIQLSMKWL